MAQEIRSLDLQTLPAALSLLNESTRGTSFESNLDFISFMLLAQFWNFSFNHSLLLYVDGEPAGLAMHCVDPELHEAFTYHWGTLPKFRTLRIAITLAEACAQKLRKDGYISVFGDSAPERPVRRWRFVHFFPKYSLSAMRCENLKLPPPDRNFEIRPLRPDALLQYPFGPDEPFHWCHRLKFLTNAAAYHTCMGAFRDNSLVGYAVALSKSSVPTLIDLRSAQGDPGAGHELLRALWQNDHRRPIHAKYVFEDSYGHRLLTDAGFVDQEHFSFLCRDLPTST